MNWKRSELAVLKKLSSPVLVQRYLDSLPYRCEDGHFSARAAMRDKMAHCFDGCMLAAAALRYHGFTPRLIDLCAENDDDHMVCGFTVGGLWGAIAKSNFPGLRYREPVFRTPRELVLSYFEFYFNLKKKKTLRSYSKPMRLPDVAMLDWERDDSAGDILVEQLAQLPHYRLLTRIQEEQLAKVDERLFSSQLVGVDLRGAYGGS